MNLHGNTEQFHDVSLNDIHSDENIVTSRLAGHENNGPDNINQSPYIRFQQELRHSLCQLCREIQTKIYRSITIRGLPRLFVLRRLFGLYWFLVVCLLIFLKLYFPLYLTSTVSRDTLEEFREDWCRVRTARNDWYSLLKICQKQYREGWSKANDSDADLSYVSQMNIKEAGDFSRFSIQTQTSDGRLKLTGGDTWRVLIHGPSSLAPTIFDHNNGTYEVVFIVLEPGDYTAFVALEYTVCEGYKDPPENWFKLEFISYSFGAASCQDHCTSLLLDGYGRWTNGSWAPYVPDNLLLNPVPRRHEGVLWIYGDSNAMRFHKSIKHRPLCTSIFARCGSTYNWVYQVQNSSVEKHLRNMRDFDIERVMTELKSILFKPELNNSQSVVILNFGLHMISAITFQNYQKLINRTIEVLLGATQGLNRYHGDFIWKSTTSMNKERTADPHHIGRRFMTRQRVLLFNAYASWAMCRAGIKILDVYPISASFPGGTGFQNNIEDSVHFKDCVFDSTITALENYYGAGLYLEQSFNYCH